MASYICKSVSEFRTRWAEVVPGDIVIMADGVYDFGNSQNIKFPDGVELRAMNYGAVLFLSQFVWNVNVGCSFDMGNGNTVRGIAFVNNISPTIQGVTIGYGIITPPITANSSCVFEHCSADGTVFSLYNWSGLNNFITWSGGRITAGRRTVFTGSSSGGSDGGISVDHAQIICNNVLGTNQGSWGDHCFAFGARGGLMQVRDSRIQVIGGNTPHQVDWCAGAWCDETGNRSQVNSFRNTYDVISNGSLEAEDFRALAGTNMPTYNSGTITSYGDQRRDGVPLQPVGPNVKIFP
jgi:hypothetical protein